MLEHVKKDAKRWLKALRAGDRDARARFDRALSNAPHTPTLRDVQLALARERGFPGWIDLRRALEGQSSSDPAHARRVEWFLENACPDHHVRGGPSHVRASHTAMRLLQRHPEIARDGFHTAVVCGDLEHVARTLAVRPEAASARNTTPDPARDAAAGDDWLADLGPKGWEPLMYLCCTRLPLAAVTENALAIARLLLDHGADPNVFFKAGDSRYTPLVGVIGEGEEHRPPHPRRDELVRLLLERGAEPYDAQVVYNIHFQGRALWFLELIYARALALGRKADWDDPEWPMLDMGGYGSGARWHLGLAIRHNDIALAEWCLAHGASPNAAPPRGGPSSQHTLHEEALRQGRPEIAALLVRHGATPATVTLGPAETFVAACLRLDRDAVRAHLIEHPEYLRQPDAIFEAVRRDRVDVISFLLEIGVLPEVESADKNRPLHVAAFAGSLRAAELLIARGADVDAVEANWSSTPLGFAIYQQHADMIDLLGRHSRDVWRLAYTGRIERLREVLASDPGRARVVSDGQTPLMWLPTDNESRAIEIAQLFLAHGVDPQVAGEDGRTPADRAERLEMFKLMRLLRDAPKPRSREGGRASATGRDA